MFKVSIQIVTWNSMKFLPDCLQSIFEQTIKNFSVLVIDNASNDGTIEFLKNNYPQVKIFRNNKNIGFAAGHNQGIKITLLNQKISTSHYLLIVNPDIILSSDFLERAVLVMEKNKKIGALSGKNMKIYTSEPEINEKVKTKIIDSTGLRVFKSRRVIDRGENETDQGQYDQQEEVFGVSGACAFYRFSALQDINIPMKYMSRLGSKKSNTNTQTSKNLYIRKEFVISSKANEASYEYFDEDLFAYKEDVDISYRLRWRGWKIIYAPTVIAYHHRQIFGGKPSINEIIKRRKKRSPLIKYFSYRNHFFLLLKNEHCLNFLQDFPQIFFYELKKFFYTLFFEPRTFRAIIEIIFKLPKMLKKRTMIMKNKKVASRKMYRWFR